VDPDRRYVVEPLTGDDWMVVDCASDRLEQFVVNRLSDHEFWVEDRAKGREALVWVGGRRGYVCWCWDATPGLSCSHRWAVHLVLRKTKEASYPWLS